MPEEGEIFNRDQAITIEVFFSDDSPSGLSAGVSGAPLTKSAANDATKKAEVRVSRTDAAGNLTPISKSTVILPAGSRDRGTLDDNGSGIDVSSFRMSIVKPNGSLIVPTIEEFVELDRAHAKYVMVPLHIPGRYTVNVRVEDCVGNVAADSWNFNVSSAAPAITFMPVEGECQYDGYWNPDSRLRLRAQIREMDGINTSLNAIRVDIVRIYNCTTGMCTDTLPNAAFTCTPLPDPAINDQVFTITGDYNLSMSVDLTELRFVVTATNALGAQAVLIQPWIVDAVAPWITIVSPQPNSVVPETMPVTISANFGDTEDGLVATLPGGRNGESVPTIKIGPQREAATKSVKTSDGDTKFSLGSWAGAVTSHLDELDGHSGVDVGCVDLILFPHSGGTPINLTEGSVVRPNNITWIGNLTAGSYTVILSVCDRVCNTASTNWDFVVAPDNAGVSYDPPYYVSSMPHTFIMHTRGENIDHTSMNLAIEGAVMILTDTSSYQLWVPVIEDAAVQWQGDSVWYTANFDLEAYVQLRLTLSMNFTYGIPVPTGSQVYVVDIGAPRIVSVTPDPEIVIAAGSTPTFQVDFAEVGNTTLDANSINVWLDNASTSQLIVGTFTSSVDGAGRTGYGRFVVSSALTFGHYRLYAEIADIAGNRTTANWTYEVGYTADSPARLLDSLTSYNYPNPFEAGQETKFSLPVSMGMGAYANIKIYDFSGSYVATIYDGFIAGTEITWAGRNDDGETVANGVYLARCVVRADGKTKEDVVKVAFKNKK